MNKIKNTLHYHRVLVVVILLLIAFILSTFIAVSLLFKEPTVRFEESELTLKVGSIEGLVLTYEPANRVFPQITYESSNNSVVEVSEEGTVTAMRGGTATITGTTRGGQEFNCDITVKNPKLGKVIYLTFNDGPGTDVTPDLLDVLKEYKATATFFPEAQNISVTEDILKREVAEGHTIGIQSYTKDFSTIYQDVDSYMEDFEQSKKLIEEVGGVTPTYWRFLGGSTNDYMTDDMKDEIIQKLHDQGYTEMDWNAYTDDGSGQELTTSEMVETCINKIDSCIKAKVPPIVMIHDDNNKTQTAEVVEEIIKHYQEEGYAFEGLDAYQGSEISIGSGE